LPLSLIASLDLEDLASFRRSLKFRQIHPDPHSPGDILSLTPEAETALLENGGRP